MQQDEKLAAMIADEWQRATGLDTPYPGTLRFWIAQARDEDQLLVAIEKTGRKCYAAKTYKDDPMTVGQAARYLSNILLNSALQPPAHG